MNAYGRILDLETAVDTLQKAVSVLQEELRKSNAPSKPELSWESWNNLLEEYQNQQREKQKHIYGPTTITDNTRSKWPQHPKPEPIFLKFEHPRIGATHETAIRISSQTVLYAPIYGMKIGDSASSYHEITGRRPYPWSATRATTQ